MGLTLLLADDHGVLRDGVQRLLEFDSGIKVVAAVGNGVDAVIKAKELRPDVAVMDISMPQLDGIEATRSIVEQVPATAVVILSMYCDEDMVARALAAGARGYLLKDSAGEEVVAAVRVVAAGGSYLGRCVPAVTDPSGEAGRARAGRPRLTPRERDIIGLIAGGRSNAETARILGLSPRTVETYRGRMMEKLKIKDLPALVKYAIRHGHTASG